MNTASKGKNITLKQFADIIGAELTKAFTGKEECVRILTQSVYSKPGDVVISAGWYPKKSTVEESIANGALAVFCDEETKKLYPDERVIAVKSPIDCVTTYQK